MMLALGEHRVGELGCCLVPAARGRGIATEALAALTDWAFADARPRPRAGRSSRPRTSRRSRLAERAGFRREGVLRVVLGARRRTPRRRRPRPGAATTSRWRSALGRPRRVRRDVGGEPERDEQPAPESRDAVHRPPGEDVGERRPRQEEQPEERPDPAREGGVDLVAEDPPEEEREARADEAGGEREATHGRGRYPIRRTPGNPACAHRGRTGAPRAANFDPCDTTRPASNAGSTG